MGDSELIESLDSLWFFSNVLAPISPKKINATVHDTTTTQEESPPKHVNPVVQNDQSPNAGSVTVTVKCPKCGEVSAEAESLQMETSINLVDGQEAENSSSRKEGKKKKRRSRRKVLGEIDVGFGVDYYKNYGMFMEETVETCGFGSQMLPMYQKKMPPLSDGLAMKQHLKSWAYAVACTVR